MKWHSVHKRLSSKHQVAYWIIKMNIGLSKLQKVTDLVSLSGIVKEGQQKNLCIKKKSKCFKHSLGRQRISKQEGETVWGMKTYFTVHINVTGTK